MEYLVAGLGSTVMVFKFVSQQFTHFQNLTDSGGRPFITSDHLFIVANAYIGIGRRVFIYPFNQTS